MTLDDVINSAMPAKPVPSDVLAWKDAEIFAHEFAHSKEGHLVCVMHVTRTVLVEVLRMLGQTDAPVTGVLVLHDLNDDTISLAAPGTLEGWTILEP